PLEAAPQRKQSVVPQAKLLLVREIASASGVLSTCLGLSSSGPPAGSVEQPIADDAIERGEGILEADLFSFFVGSARITDRHLVYAPGRVPLLGHLGRNFRLEAKAVRF